MRALSVGVTSCPWLEAGPRDIWEGYMYMYMYVQVRTQIPSAL
jgi:hypothetical protein